MVKCKVKNSKYVHYATVVGKISQLYTILPVTDELRQIQGINYYVYFPKELQIIFIVVYKY